MNISRVGQKRRNPGSLLQEEAEKTYLMGNVLRMGGKYIPLIKTIRNYKKEFFYKDLLAASTVAVVAIPQSMAYALIAGVNPIYGLYTAIVSTIISSVFGSSDHVIAGPTNAIALLIASSMSIYMGQDNAYQLLFLLTFMVGFLRILFGVIKLGKVINFVSYSVLIGYTAGAGILIGLGQLSTLLGISIKDPSHMSTIGKFYYVINHFDQVNIYALGLGVMTMAIIIISNRVNKKLPGSLIGIVIPIMFIIFFSLEEKGVELTGFIPSALPPFRPVQFDWVAMQDLFGGAMAIAVLGLVEATAIAKSIAAASGQKIDVNQEFIGQGLSNLGASFFQCFAGSGSFTRSALNYQSGAVTRIAGIMSGVIVALVVLFFAPYAQYIPNPCLAGVILVIAYNMINKQEIKSIVMDGKFKSDSIALWVTIFATIFLPRLDLAILTGIVVSIILYLKDTNQAIVKFIALENGDGTQLLEREVKSVKERLDILIIQLEGNLFFGTADDLQIKLIEVVDKSKIIVLRMKYVTEMDFAALGALKVFIRMVKEAGSTLIISGVKPELELMLKNTDLTKDVGADNFFLAEDEIYPTASNDLLRARAVLSIKKFNDSSSIGLDSPLNSGEGAFYKMAVQDRTFIKANEA